MKEYNKLVRNNALSKAQGVEFRSKKVKGKEFKTKLLALFLDEYQQSLSQTDEKKLITNYAEMLEIIKTLVVENQSSLQEISSNNSSQAMDWYTALISDEEKVYYSSTDLLERYYELLSIENNEVFKDGLKDLFVSFKQVIKANNISFKQVELLRRAKAEKIGGFDKGIYLQGVVRINENRHTV